MSALKVAASSAPLVLLAVRQWVFTLVMQVLVLALLVTEALAPQKSAALLRTVQGLLQHCGGVMFMVVSFIFGASLLFRGIAGLLAFRAM